MIVQEKKAKELLEDKIFTVSNFLSLSRVFLVPHFLIYSREYALNPSLETIRMPIYITLAAVLTDFLDGRIARFFKQETVLGRYLDPICDKVVTITGLAVAYYYFQFPLWILIFYILREIIGLWFGGFLYFKRGLQGKPNAWGKLGVGLVALTVIWYMLLPLFARWDWIHPIFLEPEISAYCLLVVLVFGLIGYSKRYWQIVFHPEKQIIDPQDQRQKKKYEIIE
jgi:CDP-diacylglycerol--glycerol-3-phosphate 3-phosphatidyltransferase